MTKKTVNPTSLPKPSGYAHGILAGNVVYLGGQTALDADMQIVPGGIVNQFRQAFSNVLVTLAEAGGRPEDLVSVTIYLTDVDLFDAVWAREHGNLPAAVARIIALARSRPKDPFAAVREWVSK